MPWRLRAGVRSTATFGRLHPSACVLKCVLDVLFVDVSSEWVGIAVMAELSKLSTDTLRWYEKEGLFPAVDRGPDGRRRYTTQQRSVILLLTALRDTGMPIGDMKHFVELMQEGAVTHGLRIDVLERNRQRLAERRAAVDAAEQALAAKIAHYRYLIDHGLAGVLTVRKSDPRAIRTLRVLEIRARADGRARFPSGSTVSTAALLASDA